MPSAYVTEFVFRVCGFHRGHHQLVRPFPFASRCSSRAELITERWSLLFANLTTELYFLSSSSPALTSPLHLLKKEIYELLIAIPCTQQIAVKFHLCRVFLKGGNIKHYRRSGPL